jgi:hypothetical protein
VAKCLHFLTEQCGFGNNKGENKAWASECKKGLKISKSFYMLQLLILLLGLKLFLLQSQYSPLTLECY